MEQEKIKMDAFAEHPMEDWSRFVRAFRRRWQWMAAVTAAAGLISIAGAASIPARYDASAKVMVEKLDRLSSENRFQELPMPSLAAEEDYFGTQIEVITSQRLLQRVQAELPLPAGTQILVRSREELYWLKSALGLYPRGTYWMEARRAKLSRVIVLEISGPDGEAASRIANELVNAYVRQSAEENLFIARQSYRWLSDSAPGAADPMSSAASAEMLPAVLQDSEVRKLKDQKIAALDDLRQMSQRYMPRHPVIREMSKRLDDINRALDERTERITRSLKSALDGELSISNVRVLDLASSASRSDAPERAAVVLGGLAFGMLAGLLLIQIWDLADRRIHSAEDLPAVLKKLVLGRIPRSRGLGERSGSTAEAYLKVLSEDIRLRDSVIGIRTHLLFSAPFDQARRIMLTSAVRDEGKSTVGLLLSMSLADLGRRILLVDADLRNPSLARKLGLPEGPGFAEYLAGSADLRQSIRAVPGHALHVLASRAEIRESSSLLASNRFDAMMEVLSESYDRIIFVASAMLESPDSLIVAKHISCGILVCATEVVRHDQLGRIVDEFERMRRPVLGVVVNDLKAKCPAEISVKSLQKRTNAPVLGLRQPAPSVPPQSSAPASRLN